MSLKSELCQGTGGGAQGLGGPRSNCVNTVSPLMTREDAWRVLWPMIALDHPLIDSGMPVLATHLVTEIISINPQNLQFTPFARKVQSYFYFSFHVDPSLRLNLGRGNVGLKVCFMCTTNC